MSKKQHKVELFGILEDGKQAGTHNAHKVVAFTNEKRSIMITPGFANVRVVTNKGEYNLPRSLTTKNLWKGILKDGIKAQYSQKKIVAHLFYWA